VSDQRALPATITAEPPTPLLAKFYAAKSALREARTADEVMHIRNDAIGMAAAAQAAKDTEMEENAAELRLRAERKLGQMLEEGKAYRAGHGGDRKSKGNDDPLKKPTLDELGIDKNLAKAARKAAEPSATEFERRVEAVRGQARRLRWRAKRSGGGTRRDAQTALKAETADLKAKLAHSEDLSNAAEMAIDQLVAALTYVRDTAGDEVWRDLKMAFPTINHMLGSDGDERDRWDAKVAGWLDRLKETGAEPDPDEVLGAINGADADAA